MRTPWHRANPVAGAAALLALTLVAACDSAGRSDDKTILLKTIPVGIVQTAPGFDSGTVNPAGFDIDVMNAVGAGLNSVMSPTLLDYSDRATALTSGKAALVIATYSITKDRNDAGIDFAGPYMAAPQAMLVRADSNIRTRNDMKGKSVCTVATTTGAADHIPGAIMAEQAQTTQQCVDMLKQGNTDAVFTDSLILYGYSQANPGAFKVVLPGVFGQEQYLGIGLAAGHHADCEKLNAIITDYLRTQWARDFQANFPQAVAAYTGADAASGTYETQFKPSASDMERLSCRL